MLPREVYLVGTIPLVRALDVFGTVAALLGDRVRRVPDGEIGDRKMWIVSQYPVLAACPALMVGDFPAEGLTRRTCYQIPVCVRPGIEAKDIVLSELGYARHALASFALFRALKKAGRIPQRWKFQAGLPTPMDVMMMVEPGSRAMIEMPYERALLAELGRIQTAIPHDQLAITWDAVQGVLLWEDPSNSYVAHWIADPTEGVIDRLTRLGNAVAPDVELGYHLCYGSQDHKHAIEPRDLSACVNLANSICGRLKRQVDYVHMPVPRARMDDAYFAPLAKLARDRVKQLYLGLVHYTDGVAGASRRIAAAERYLPEFGIATECGFGRRPSEQDVRKLLELHAQVMC